MDAASPVLAGSPPVFITLFTGLLIAFAVQLLLTTFGVAAGITAIGALPNAPAATEATDSSASSADSTATAGKLGFAIGAGTLLTVNLVLFTACFLAVKLSLVNSPVLGAVLGIVIWSGYFLALLWLSSKAAGSLLGALVGAVSAGVQGLLATVTNALGRDRAVDERSPALSKRLAATEASLTTMQEQMEANDRTVEASLRAYVQTLQPPKPDLQTIRETVAQVLADSGLTTVAKTDLRPIDRQTLAALVSSRTDFSTRDVNEVVNQLESVWQEVVGAPDAIADLTTFFQAASPEMLTPETVNERLQRLLADQPKAPVEPQAAPLTSVSLEPKQLIKRLTRIVRDRIDLSDLDVGSLVQQLQTFASSSQQPDASDAPDAPDASNAPATNDRAACYNTTIKADIEDYLLNAYSWNLTRKTVQAEFTDVIYDPEANPAAVRQQLSRLDRVFFVGLLEQRDDLAPTKVAKIADRLQETQQTVLQRLNAAIAEAPLQAFSRHVAIYLQSASQADLQPARLQKELQAMLEAEVPVDRWRAYLHALSRDRLETMLTQQAGQRQLEARLEALETSRDRLLVELEKRQADAEAEAAALWQALEVYVRDRSQKLTARDIQRQFKALIKASKVKALQLPPFDRPTAAQWLDDRPALSEKQRQRVLDQLEKAWERHRVPSEATAPADDHPLLPLLQDYLQTIEPSTFNVAAVPQDFLNYLKQQRVSHDWLSQITPPDWKPLLQQVQQRRDLTETQRQQLFQQMQRSLYTLSKLPRRLALRSQQQTQSWQDQLSDYLRDAERDDLSLDRLSDAIQRLLDHLHTAGAESLDWQHLTTLSRDRLVTLLSERNDISQDDINQIVAQIETTVQQTIAQAQTVQQQVQATIAKTLDQLRQSITSLPLPELDYDRLKHELQQVLVDPRAGLESLSSSLGDTLRDQLNTLNRDTLTALISTRDDISATFAQQITDRIDAARLGAIAQIETVQQAAQRRLEDLKQHAQQQANETRKAVAIAAWWLFATALSSAFTSAIAGILAVGGIEWVKQVIGV